MKESWDKPISYVWGVEGYGSSIVPACVSRATARVRALVSVHDGLSHTPDAF